jgi:hypothetical protein
VVTPATLHPDLAGAVVGLVLAFTFWLLPSCDDPDPFDPPPLWIELEKLPASPAIIAPADGCWYGGEKWEHGTARMEPNS